MRNHLCLTCLTLFFCFSFLNAQDTKLPVSSSGPITLRRVPVPEKQKLANTWIKAHRDTAEVFAQNILNSMDKNAELLVLEDLPTLSLWLLQKENDIPKTVSIYDFDGTFFQSLPTPFGEPMVHYGATHTVEEIFQVRQMAEMELISGSTVHVYSSSRRDTTDLPGYSVVPSGLVYMFWRDGMPKPDYKKILKEIVPLDSFLKIDSSTEARNMCAITHYMVGVNYLQMNDKSAKEKAKIELRKSASLSGDMKGIHIMLAESFMGLNDLDDAFASAQTALQKRPDSPKSYYICGDYFISKKDFNKAVAYYEQGLTHDSNNPSARFTLGTLYRKIGQNETAVPWFITFLQAYPKYYDAYLQLAEIYDQYNDTPNALKNYQSYLDNVPNSPDSSKIKKRIELLRKKIK